MITYKELQTIKAWVGRATGAIGILSGVLTFASRVEPALTMMAASYGLWIWRDRDMARMIRGQNEPG